MVAQTIYPILHRSFMDETMRLRIDSSFPRHRQNRRLGAAMDGGKHGSSDHLCDASIPFDYERDSVLYRGYFYQEEDCYSHRRGTL